MKKRNFTASSMRVLLGTALPLLIGLMLGGFYLAYSSLKTVAAEVSGVQQQAATADAQLQSLIKTEQQLKKYEGVVKKSQMIVAESHSYRYQDQAIEDLTAYAARAGVSIAGFTFQDSDPQSSPSTGGSSAGGSQQKPQSAPSTQGLKTTMISVNLGASVRYQNFLHFVRLIEENLTKMQISQFTISLAEDKNNVVTQALNIEVYIR